MGLPKLPEGSSDLITWTDSAGQAHALNADVVVQADDTRSLTLTVHPVEGGSDVADHVVHDPDKIVFTIAQTQTPIYEDDQFSYQTQVLHFQPSTPRGIAGIVVGAVSNLISGGPDSTITVSVLSANSPVDRVAEFHDKLIDVLQNVYPITIAFKGRTYANFVLTSVKLSHNKGEVGLGRFECQAQQFRTVSTATTTLPDPTTLHAKPNKDGGKKPTTAVDGAAPTSIAKSLTDKLGVTNAGSGL